MVSRAEGHNRNGKHPFCVFFQVSDGIMGLVSEPMEMPSCNHESGLRREDRSWACGESTTPRSVADILRGFSTSGCLPEFGAASVFWRGEVGLGCTCRQEQHQSPRRLANTGTTMTFLKPRVVCMQLMCAHPPPRRCSSAPTLWRRCRLRVTWLPLPT